MRKTKIICTIGPTSEDQGMLASLISNGMNTARLNFSHGSHENHQKKIDTIKKVRGELGKQVAILLDTKGPEIRTGKFKEDKVQITKGDKFTLTTRDVEGTNKICSVSYKDLHKDISVGDTVLIDDGLVGLTVEAINDQDIECKINNSGTLSNNKGVSIPDVKINLPALTERDEEDIKFGIENDVDFIAASFIRKASDILEIRKVLERNSGTNISLISKIENREAVKNIDEIIKLSDGIMIARGDLGVGIPPEEVPLVQKMIIEKCNFEGKFVITATQMLDSMIRNPRPTRAEASDIANAIFDGTDAIMLSGETANGKYPLESFITMRTIAEKAETALKYDEVHQVRKKKAVANTTNAISFGCATASGELGAAAIIAATQSGHTAKMISKYRPKCPIIATTPYDKVARQLSLVSGVIPIIVPESDSVDELLDSSIEESLNRELLKKGDLIVFAAGVPVGYTGTTNMMRIHVVGDILANGSGMGSSTYGYACVVKNEGEIENNLNTGDILVAKTLSKKAMHFVLDRAGGVILENGGLTSHIAIECISMNIPIIVGAKGSTDIIKTGSLITIDTINGLVYSGKANVM
ncbi:pyruvate kinase [Clostridium cylindrosporum]|uniref:Pyruvate kinase n=1 Tax=Clostridium cylindrosporum DSM 605 TaxID=1121307 RepID=A0A0J8D5G0_CLOCY|nr:pyruvate kinase [Clostridium cylindrosporum]KMT21057.1 pyruvate kinase Pyk [Clostridium cylindrosporum DSM 605]